MKLSIKLLAVLIASFSLMSCDVGDDDGFARYSEISRILDADVPDTMLVGETYMFDVIYEKNSNCQNFSSFQTVNQGDSLYFVRAISTFTETGNCDQDSEEVTREVTFSNTFDSNFTFKFLKDIDSIGDFVYLDKEVIVVEQ